jgi:hypothetical protein
VAANKASFTGHYLKALLAKSGAPVAAVTPIKKIKAVRR